MAGHRVSIHHECPRGRPKTHRIRSRGEGEGCVDEHLVVHVVVPLGELQIPVDGENVPKEVVFIHVDALRRRGLGVHVAGRVEEEADTQHAVRLQAGSLPGLLYKLALIKPQREAQQGQRPRRGGRPNPHASGRKSATRHYVPTRSMRRAARVTLLALGLFLAQAQQEAADDVGVDLLPAGEDGGPSSPAPAPAPLRSAPGAGESGSSTRDAASSPGGSARRDSAAEPDSAGSSVMERKGLGSGSRGGDEPRASAAARVRQNALSQGTGAPPSLS